MSSVYERAQCVLRRATNIVHHPLGNALLGADAAASRAANRTAQQHSDRCSVVSARFDYSQQDPQHVDLVAHVHIIDGTCIVCGVFVRVMMNRQHARGCRMTAAANTLVPQRSTAWSVSTAWHG